MVVGVCDLRSINKSNTTQSIHSLCTPARKDYFVTKSSIQVSFWRLILKSRLEYFTEKLLEHFLTVVTKMHLECIY